MTWLSGRWRTLGVAVITSLVAVGTGIVLSSPAAPEPTPLSTSVRDLDTGTMTLARTSFCDRVAPADIGAALASTKASTAVWNNGDRLKVGTTTDVVHEYGCRWSAADRTAAAWIYAPPVTVEGAADLVTRASETKGCTPISAAPSFGTPSVALTCGSTVSYRGLYGDAWLVCTLSATGNSATTAAATTALSSVAEHWCASVALAARAGVPS